MFPNCWAGALGPLDLGWLAETMWLCPGLREATQGRGAPHMASGFDLGLKQAQFPAPALLSRPGARILIQMGKLTLKMPNPKDLP